MAHPEHQRYWFVAAAGCGTLGLGMITAAASLASSTSHLALTNPFMVTGYVAFAFTVGCFVGGIRQLRFPFARTLNDPVTITTLIPPAFPSPINVEVTPEQKGVMLHLVVLNHGDRGQFSAEVISIVDPDGTAIGTQFWPIPWKEDGSVTPKEILNEQSRTLDFARYDVYGVNDDLASGHWGTNRHWWFSSIPGPIGVYSPVRLRSDLEVQRFLVTVRISRAEPRDHDDSQFAIGVKNFTLICEHNDAIMPELDRWKGWCAVPIRGVPLFALLLERSTPSPASRVAGLGPVKCRVREPNGAEMETIQHGWHRNMIWVYYYPTVFRGMPPPVSGRYGYAWYEQQSDQRWRPLHSGACYVAISQ